MLEKNDTLSYKKLSINEDGKYIKLKLNMEKFCLQEI